MEKSNETIINNYADSVTKLTSILGVSETRKIVDAICEWADLSDANVEEKTISHYGSKRTVFESKKRDGYFFESENEAKLLNVLADLSPETETSKLVTVISIVAKLLDIKDMNQF